MTIYELNQINYGKLPPLNETDIAAADQTIADFLNWHRANYYMLLNHELRYFTLFHQESPQFRHITRDNILAILQELGVDSWHGGGIYRPQRCGEQIPTVDLHRAKQSGAEKSA